MKFFLSTLFIKGTLGLLIAYSATGKAIADTLPLPPGIPAPSFVNDMVEIGSSGNSDDSTGYGGVAYKYRVSQTQITVQDWVDFLNNIGVTGADDLGLGPMTTSHSDCDNGWCYSPFEYSGGQWRVIAFNQSGMNLDASEAANLPIDWLSLNNVARYLNWLSTGDIDTGAFTFTNDGGPEGNWPIASFNGAYPGPRLPLEDELYKAMYRDSNSNTYYDYPLGSNSMASATSDVNSGLHDSNIGSALLNVFNNGGGLYAQVGQETGNSWGILDAGGNRHETTLNPGATTTTILRGAASFGALGDSHKTARQSLDAGRRYISIGYRVWMGVSDPSGVISITKQVTGGTDNQQFTVSLDCTGTLYDVSNIQISHGETWESDAIPAGTSCSVTETAPAAPNGFTYGAPVIAPSTVTVGNGTTTVVTVTNPLQTVQAGEGNLRITKDVTGAPAGFVSPDFSITVTCSGNVAEQTITLEDGESQTIEDIPAGTTCTITEPTQPAPPSGYSYATPDIVPSSVTIQGSQTVSVIVTNPLDGDCAINQPVITPHCYNNGTSDSADDTFGFRINTTGNFVATMYDIRGAIDVDDVPYDSESGIYGNFLISDGNVNINLADQDEAACQLNDLIITAPQSCSTTPACEVVTNTASVTAVNEADQDITNNTGDATLRVNCDDTQIDLSLTKTASETTVQRGSVVTYTLTLENQSSELGTGIAVRDELPAGITYISHIPSQGTYDVATGIWQVGDVQGQEQATLIITVSVD
uniref:DUF11 domain-containing protein n=1 Tax=uncultured Thiotrichaceae bacterium TaxID=298394 RepID=A0A6S6UA69_9GAMM|nr:MAG: Unknown protein [uncultured Thiotrichaceae bacterium]